MHFRNPNRGSDHTLLPTKSPLPGDSWRPRSPPITKRYVRILIAGLISLSTLALLCLRAEPIEEPVLLPETFTPDLPPLYPQYQEYERRLPQHDPTLPFPEGKDAKYIFFANHINALGWGNALQELFLNAHLAHSIKRSLVFDNYTWDRDGPEYSDYKGKLIPSRIPLSTMITGPMIGGSYGPGSDVPRAVHKDYFYEICPEPTIISTRDLSDSLSNSPTSEVLASWADKINSMEDRCIEIDRHSGQIFDAWIFGSTRVLDIWPTFFKSPVLQLFGWSPLILSAYKANKDFFEAPPFFSFLPSVSFLRSWFMPSPHAPLPGVIALHIRRGDFVDHCHHLSNWSSQYNGFNCFPELPDKFAIPPGGGAGENTPENEAYYMEHCFPTIPQMVEKVMKIRAETKGRALRRIHIMTNGAKEWIAELKDALHAAGQWDMIVSSRDLELTWEQKYVAQALDMYVGSRAQVFVGNGFSSLTSNVAMLRMAHKLPPANTRFW